MGAADDFVDCRQRVRYAETDQMGLAYHSHYLVWFEVGRSEFCRRHGFSYQEMEDQADRVGLRYAHEAGYDISKGLDLWEKFADKYGETSRTVNFFFGDHSRSSKRQELLQLEIERNYADPDGE